MIRVAGVFSPCTAYGPSYRTTIVSVGGEVSGVVALGIARLSRRQSVSTSASSSAIAFPA